MEVTKLSLLLKVLEDESAETIGKQLEMFRERALPDLGKNIKCGNSLIGPEIFSDLQMNMLNEEAIYHINAFDWTIEFPEIMATGGFDAVIGNPPYVRIGKDIFSTTEVKYLGRYKVAQYRTDLFHLFMQRGLDLLKNGGQFGYIVPNPWLSMKFGRESEAIHPREQ